MGYSEVAIRYMGSFPSSVPSTWYRFSEKSDSWQVYSIMLFFMKYGGWIAVKPFLCRLIRP